MKGLIKTLLTAHWLNMDTALGAVASCYFFAFLLQVTLPPVVALTLALAVLAIYNLDHLMDAARLPGQALTTRHRFYQRSFRWLVYYQAALMAVLLGLSFLLPHAVLRIGVGLGGLVLIYFLLLFGRRASGFLFKEVFIAVVFVLGALLPPLSLAHAGAWRIIIWPVGQFILLAVANTLLFAWYDYEVDRQETHISIALTLGRRHLKRLIHGILMVFLIAGVAAPVDGQWVCASVILWLMWLVFLLIALFPQTFGRHERFRIFGEAVFLLPVLVWLC